MTKPKHDPEDFRSEIEDLNTVVADYKQKLAAGDIKPRKTPVPDLPKWSTIPTEEQSFLEGLTELDLQAYARARVMAWLARVRKHLTKHRGPIAFGKVNPQRILREAQVEHRRITGVELDVEPIYAALTGLWPERLLRPTAPKPAANKRPRRRRLPWKPVGPFELRKAGSVAAHQNHT